MILLMIKGTVLRNGEFISKKKGNRILTAQVGLENSGEVVTIARLAKNGESNPWPAGEKVEVFHRPGLLFV